MSNATMDSVIEDLQSAIECEDITDADYIEEWLTDRCQSEITNDDDALEYLKETRNGNAYWYREGKPEKPEWISFAQYALEADICDEISYEDFFNEHAPGDRCEGCNDRITDEDEKITTVDGDVYELCCVSLSDADYLQCKGCDSGISDTKYGATEVNGTWYCSECEPDDEDEGDTFSPSLPSNFLNAGSSMTLSESCTICGQAIDAAVDRYRASSLGGYVHLICP